MLPLGFARHSSLVGCVVFFFQAEDGIRDYKVTGVQTCALPICTDSRVWRTGLLFAVCHPLPLLESFSHLSATLLLVFAQYRVVALLVASHDTEHIIDRKSTRLNSSHLVISYAVFCLKKKNANAIGDGTSLYPSSSIHSPFQNFTRHDPRADNSPSHPHLPSPFSRYSITPSPTRSFPD